MSTESRTINMEPTLFAKDDLKKELDLLAKPRLINVLMQFYTIVDKTEPIVVFAKDDLKKELDLLTKPSLIDVFMQFHSLVGKTLSGAVLECPFCGSHCSKFLSFGHNSAVGLKWKIVGTGFRHNVICPTCFSKDRERLLYLYLKYATMIFSQTARVLHVAPERCLRWVLEQQPGIDYLSIDLHDQNVMMNADLTNLPFAAESFDLVICSHVLEHVPEDRRAMNEIYRVLRSAGMAILPVPISWEIHMTYEDPSKTTDEEREMAFGQSDHVRIYGSDYVDRLENAGFVVEIVDAREKFGEELTKRHGLVEGEKLFVGRKMA